MPLFSVVIPVYGCEATLSELYKRLKAVFNNINADFEIIFVNDGSKDDAWITIEELSAKDNCIIGIDLSRNFGQHVAITAGLDHCKGDWIIVMDCDLQDQPEEIEKLYLKTKEGYDFVMAKRDKRKDKLLKRIFSRLFNYLLNWLTGSKYETSVANFGIYSKKVIQSINLLREKTRWFPTYVYWVGFKGTSIQVNHAARNNGKSSYSFRKLLNIAIDVIILNSDKPLKLVIKLGFLISTSSLIFALITIYKYLTGQVTVLGWTSLIISVWFLSGMIIFILGIIGLYLSKIYEHSKDRPLYLIKETISGH